MSLRETIRAGLRPIARHVRAMLDPIEPPPELQWRTITDGPSKGRQLKLPTPSVLSDRIVRGQFEPVESQVVQQLIEPTDHCIDIGGHYGHYTMLLSALASQGHVHTFETVRSLA